MSVIEAIRKTEAHSREDVKKGLDNFGVFEGATGKIQFDENGDVLKDFSKIIVKDGKFIPYKK